MSYLRNVEALKNAIATVPDLGNRVHAGVRHLRDSDRIQTLLASSDGEGLSSIAGGWLERKTREEIPYTQLSTIGLETWHLTLLTGFVNEQQGRMESIVGRVRRAVRDEYRLGDMYDQDITFVSPISVVQEDGVMMEKVVIEIQGTETFDITDPGMRFNKTSNTDYKEGNLEREQFETGIEEDIASLIIDVAPHAQMVLGNRDMSTKEDIQIYLASTEQGEGLPIAHSYQIKRDSEPETSGLGKRTETNGRWNMTGVMSWSDKLNTYERLQVELDELAGRFRFYRHLGSRHNWTQIISQPLQILDVDSMFLYDMMVHKAELSVGVSETIHAHVQGAGIELLGQYGRGFGGGFS